MSKVHRRSIFVLPFLLALSVLAVQGGVRAEFIAWWPAPGCAKVIAANDGPFLNLWAIGAGGGDQPVYQWDDSIGWLQHPLVFASRIALPETQSGGNPWLAEADGNIWAWDGSRWIGKSGCAREIAFDLDDRTVWVIGCTRVGSSDYSIHRLRPGASQWERVSGSGTRIGRLSSVVAMTNSAGKFFIWNDNRSRFEEKNLPSGFTRAEIRGSKNVILTSPGRRELWEWFSSGWSFVSPNTPNNNVIWTTRDYAVNGNCEIFFRHHDDAS